MPGSCSRSRSASARAASPTRCTTRSCDPGVGEVQRCYERAREMRADAFVAVGGGSAIDTAKMAATLLANGGTVLDDVGIDKVPKPAAPVVAVPTTAGTGADVTIDSLNPDPEPPKKLVLLSPNAP